MRKRVIKHVYKKSRAIAVRSKKPGIDDKVAYHESMKRGAARNKKKKKEELNKVRGKIVTNAVSYTHLTLPTILLV